jgi:pimeloyl-ACP methyl ester carboxylesterase
VTRKFLLPVLSVLVSVAFFASPRDMQAQTNPNHFVLSLGSTTLSGETVNGLPGGNVVFNKIVPAETFDPVGGVNRNGLPTQTLSGGGPSSVSITVKVLNQGNSGAPVHFQIVETFQSQDSGNLGLSLQSSVSFLAFFSPAVSGAITVRSVLSISTQVPSGNEGPDLASTGFVGSFSDGTSLNTCTTTFSQVNGNTSPPCVLVPLNGSPAVFKSITRPAVTSVSGSPFLFIGWGMPYTATLTTDIIGGSEGPLITLLDPIPSLVSGNPYALSTDPNVLGNQGTVIQATAADGVAKVVIRISGLTPSQTITLDLLNDQGTLADVGQNGGLGDPGNTTFTQNSLNLSAQPVGSNYMAFAVYSPPADFARPSVQADNSLVSRLVTVQIQDSHGNQLTSSNIQILRPPVLFIHGIWSDQSTWNEFDARMKTLLPNLFTCRVDYSASNGASVDFNTPPALERTMSCLRDFKTMEHASAGQLDFIVHSMGGLISNNMPKFSPSAFQSIESYSQGYIHKLITVDTPYYGSQFAMNLSQSSVWCKAEFNLLHHKVNGAVTDLVPGSNVLTRINPLSSLYYKHAISGELTTPQSVAASVIVDLAAFTVFGVCHSLFVTDLTRPPFFSFDNYFGGSTDPFGGANDLIVAKTSQLGPLQAFSDSAVGVAHIHLAIPWIPLTLYVGALDKASRNPDLAVTLLNTPVSNGRFLH